MPSPTPHILAIDLGTGGPKVSLVTITGRVLATAFEPTPLIHTPDGGIEQDANDWWRAVSAAARAAIAAAPPAAGAPVAIAVTAQWFTTVAVDHRGDPLMNAISWMDGRGGTYSRSAMGPGPRVAGYNPLKLARWLRRTGGAPSRQGHDPVGQILFIKHRHPVIYERTSAFLEPGDFLTTRMTGRIVTAAETATGCWSTDTRDISAIDYDDALLRMTGLERSRLAPVVATGSIAGELLPARARELGLADGPPIPVVASTPDVMSAAVGSGAVTDGAMHLCIGTSAWLSGHVPHRCSDALHNIAALPSSIAGRYLLCSEQQTAGACLTHLRDRLLDTPDVPLDELVAEAGQAAPGSGGAFFAPWLNGERTPLDNASVRGAYMNLSLQSGRPELVRATLEGVAFNARWMQHHTERLMRRRVDDIALIGGGAQSAVWCQIVSDVLDRTVRRIEHPRQANTRGAALLAAVAIGQLAVDDIPGLVPADATFTPEPANRGLYDERFDAFRRFYKSNRALYSRLNNPNPEGRHD